MQDLDSCGTDSRLLLIHTSVYVPEDNMMAVHAPTHAKTTTSCWSPANAIFARSRIRLAGVLARELPDHKPSIQLEVRRCIFQSPQELPAEMLPAFRNEETGHSEGYAAASLVKDQRQARVNFSQPWGGMEHERRLTVRNHFGLGVVISQGSLVKLLDVVNVEKLITCSELAEDCRNNFAACEVKTTTDQAMVPHVCEDRIDASKLWACQAVTCR